MGIVIYPKSVFYPFYPINGMYGAVRVAEARLLRKVTRQPLQPLKTSRWVSGRAAFELNKKSSIQIRIS